MSAAPTLKKALNQRQLTMIAIGGVIGAGLFVGSGVVIADTGPGAFLTYGMAGVLIIMVMRMLAEMAVANPSTGSFADYSRNALGHWAGFSVGWLYWYFWVIVVGFEAIAGAKIVQYWMDVPLWLSALIFMVLMTATNLFSVASYGEFEFWFAGIKVAAIIAFIAVGAAFVLGLWPGKGADFSNLTSHGGFMPLGFGAITVGIVTVIFSMVGAEIATIAAAESQDPERAVAKAANSVILRILIFYVGAVLLLVLIVPWNDESVSASPFVAAFNAMGIPYADHVMNAVVLTAVLSCLNSGMYTASRMLFVLAARREAPAALVKVTNRGVPANAILASSVVGFLCVIAAAVSPDTIFAFLLNSSGAIILFVYLLIAISQIVLRYRTPDSKLRVKMWLFPVLSGLTALGILAILVQMFIDTALRSQLVLSLLSWAVVIALFAANKWFVKKRPAEGDSGAPTGPPHRVLVLANRTVDSDELLAELSRIGADQTAEYLVVVPASAVDTGAAATHGPRDVTEATQEAATARLESTLAALRGKNLTVQGELGDYRPLRALDHAVAEFGPDQIVIATLPPEFSMWHRFDVVDRARAQFTVPVTHVVATSAVGNQVPR
ncbi:amino acid permease [Mycolicibacterium gilvum]|uniref:Gamma-aminobutyrate permease-like transporter n=3 Tax=Mycolicibacterium gilvum TaxID=1804 RepID=E6TK06_MYCSR|nr:amino acid permease [Mycolicibacterium gilvum]ABP44476.1 gamma-aminobutyrate:proton symporter, AAT family [Mycolicibacterium gilvum PYR-GCK]ADT98095.1 gamma-aminobutyrate permease-like transporter [Mycolicibacterium gilvum Spyr1]MCV7058404.1 amino acid permease [Mycolicibacterium gilvum]STZ45210.1 amino acid permease-associated protein [Mycolicibacterium gilvum]